jgi:hypothetical protein
MAQLAAALHFPARGWPVTPADTATALMLQHGMNLYSAQGRESMVFTFLELLQSEFVQAFTVPEHALGLRRQDQIKKALRDEPVSATVRIPNEDLPRDLDDGCAPWAVSDLSCSRRTLNVEAAAAAAVRYNKVHSTGTGTGTGTDTLQTANDPSGSGSVLHLSQADVEALRSVPLQIVGLDDFVSWELVQEQRSQELPVDLSGQPASKASVAAELLQRLKADVKG